MPYRGTDVHAIRGRQTYQSVEDRKREFTTRPIFGSFRCALRRLRMAPEQETGRNFTEIA